MAELIQATGANARVIYGAENVWGTSPTSGYKEVPLVGGESLDDQTTVYRSNQIRSDRTQTLSVRGTQKPGGGMPMELAATGPVPFFLRCLLGGASTDTSLGGGKYSHVFKGTTSSLLPSFTLEKGFQDLAIAQYRSFNGCRVGQGQFGFSIDAIATMAMDLMARQATDYSGTSVAGTSAVTSAPLTTPFTSIQIVLTKDGVTVSEINNLTMTVNNGLYGDSGFVLGSTLRQNLMAGTRRTTGEATFLFTSPDWFNLARAGTLFALKILCTDAATFSVEFRMDSVQLLPNGSDPKIENDGPLTMRTQWEAVKNTGLGSDIQCTVINDSATIS